MPSVLTVDWWCMRPGRTAPAHRVRPWPWLTTVGLRVLLLALAGDERAPARSVGAGPADLGLGAVDAQLHAVGRRVGDHIRQGPQPQRGLAGHGEAAGGQQRADLADGAGDGGAVDPEQHRQGLVRQLPPSTIRVANTPGRTRPAAGGAGAGGAAAWVAAAVDQRGLVLGGPGVGQLGDELAQVLPGDASEARMG